MASVDAERETRRDSDGMPTIAPYASTNVLDYPEGEIMSVDYCENGDFVDSPLWWHKLGLSQTASGYGGKLTSRYKTQFNGRLYRVYVMCYGNAGSAYIIVKGVRLFLRNS